MLCNGRLFACAGHRVSPHLLNSFRLEETNAVTMLRHPWNRLQSDYHYFKSKPNSAHLSPEIDPIALLAYHEHEHEHEHESTYNELSGLVRFIHYPGISNCMTKMLNGFQCGDDLDHVLQSVGDDEYSTDMKEELLLTNAKNSLQSFLFVGIQEQFDRSICLFVWMYGMGSASSNIHYYDVESNDNSNYNVSAINSRRSTFVSYGPSRKARHFSSTRVGKYNYIPIGGETKLEKEVYELFKESERLDIKLYDYALQLFHDRVELTELK